MFQRNLLKVSKTKNPYFQNNTENKILAVIEKNLENLIKKPLLIMSKLKIILVGCVEFSLKLSVAIMKKKNIEIIGICTKKSINSDFCDLSFFAKK